MKITTEKALVIENNSGWVSKNSATIITAAVNTWIKSITGGHKRGYIYDTVALFAVVLVILATIYVWQVMSVKLGTVMATPDTTDFIVRFNVGLQGFDSNLPYLFGAFVVTSIAAFASVSINRFAIFIFAFIILSVGAFLQFAEPQLVQMVILLNVQNMPNLMYIIGQLKILMLLEGFIMLIVGFVRGV